MLRLVHAVHRRALAVVYAQFSDPEGSLLAGIVLGDESGIPPKVEEAFQRTGATHVIASSGQNAIVFIVFPRFPLTFASPLATSC
jgi:predicted membrane metal-binding protein